MKERGGLGPALRRRLGILVVPAAGARPARTESLLMNPTRLKVFQAVYNLPCSNMRGLSRKVGVAPPSMRWHLGKLAEGGLVRTTDQDGRRLFYASGAIEDEDVGILTFLAPKNRREAVRAVCQDPGVTQSRLLRASGCNGHTVRALAARGILQVVRDGRHKRYYPGEELARRMREYEGRAPRSRQLLLSALAREGIQPESSDPGRGFWEIRVRAGDSAETLRFRRNPFDLSRW